MNWEKLMIRVKNRNDVTSLNQRSGEYKLLCFFLQTCYFRCLDRCDMC